MMADLNSIAKIMANPAKMKEAVSHQMEAVADTTTSLGKGLKKSVQTYQKEAGRFAKSITEIVDVEDILKSIHKVAKPELHENRQSSIIHTTIDWSKTPPPSQKRFPEDYSMTDEEENENEDKRNGAKHINITGSPGKVDRPSKKDDKKLTDRIYIRQKEKSLHKRSVQSEKSMNNPGMRT